MGIERLGAQAYNGYGRNCGAQYAHERKKKMKKVVLDGYTACPDDPDYACFAAMGETTVYDRTPPELVVQRIADAPIILTNKTVISREVMDACPEIKYIGVLATGYNVVDIEAAKERGIVVSNVPAYSTQAVVQHTMALLLHAFSRVSRYDERVKRGDWVSSQDFCFFDGETEEAADKVFGVIGYGHIGRASAHAAQALGMRVLVYTPHPPKDRREGDPEFVTLEELLGESDVISLHCPLSEKTRGIIGGENIGKMKRGVRVINTARGPLVDSGMMAQALESGHVACYMADVLEQEPPAADDVLLRAKNTVITPHIAWAPKQTRERLVSTAVGNALAFERGEPRNVVSG